MAKVQLDLDEKTHFKIKEYQLEIERSTKERLSLKAVYEIVIKKGLEALKTKNPDK